MNASGIGEIEVGLEIPTFSRKTGFDVWNRFAGVNYEFVPIHMDDEAGKAAGHPGAIGMGRLQWSYLHNALEQWLGEHGRVVRVAAQFRSPNLKGMTLIARGKVTALREENNETLIDLDVWVEAEDGKMLAPGTATVALN
jgi:acyl dehydratase